MATFGRGRLCAPITDDDLRQVDVDPDTGATTVTLLNDFVVSVNGTPTTVTVPLPSDAGLEYGYYTDATAEADSWLLALETAIEAAEGGSWTLAERGGDVCGNVTRYSYTRNGLGVGPVQFQMDNASTTIDPKLLGFDADTYSGSPTVNAPFAAPHCWRPGTISWVSTEPLRNVSQVKSASVKTSNHLTGGTQQREIIPSRNMPIAKVLKSGTVHDTDIAAVPNLANDDPNYPLESLWEVAWNHLPLKWLPIETLPKKNIKYLQIDGSQALSDMRTFITKQNTNLRFFNINLPLIQWEPIGGKDFDIHAVVCGGGVVDVTDFTDLRSKVEATGNVGTTYRFQYTDGISGTSKTLYWTKRNDTGDFWTALESPPVYIPSQMWDSTFAVAEVGTFPVNGDGSLDFSLSGAEAADAAWVIAPWNRCKVMSFFNGGAVPGLVGVKFRMSNTSRNAQTFAWAVLLNGGGSTQNSIGTYISASGVGNMYQNTSGRVAGTEAPHNTDSNTPAFIELTADWMAPFQATFGGAVACIGYVRGLPSAGNPTHGRHAIGPASATSTNSLNYNPFYPDQYSTYPQRAALIISGNGNAFNTDVYGIELVWDVDNL